MHISPTKIAIPTTTMHRQSHLKWGLCPAKETAAAATTEKPSWKIIHDEKEKKSC